MTDSNLIELKSLFSNLTELEILKIYLITNKDINETKKLLELYNKISIQDRDLNIFLNLINVSNGFSNNKNIKEILEMKGINNE